MKDWARRHSHHIRASIGLLAVILGQAAPLESTQASPPGGRALAHGDSGAHSFSSATTLTNRFTEAPDFKVDRATEKHLAPIGEFDTGRVGMDAAGETGPALATAVLISPCHIVTSAHAVLNGKGSLQRETGAGFIFRAGVGNGKNAFLGNTPAKLVITGNYTQSGANDWAILELKSCIGARPDFGWFDGTAINQNKFHELIVATVGFAGDRPRGELSASVGPVIGRNIGNSMLIYCASAGHGQSGGAILAVINGKLSLVGIDARERMPESKNVNQSCSMSNANEFVSISSFILRPDVRAILEEAKAKYKHANAAAPRMPDRLPSPPRP